MNLTVVHKNAAAPATGIFCDAQVSGPCRLEDVQIKATTPSAGKLDISVQVNTGHFGKQAAAIGSSQINKALKSTVNLKEKLGAVLIDADPKRHVTVFSATCSTREANLQPLQIAEVHAAICGKGVVP